MHEQHGHIDLSSRHRVLALGRQGRDDPRQTLRVRLRDGGEHGDTLDDGGTEALRGIRDTRRAGTHAEQEDRQRAVLLLGGGDDGGNVLGVRLGTAIVAEQQGRGLQVVRRIHEHGDERAVAHALAREEAPHAHEEVARELRRLRRLHVGERDAAVPARQQHQHGAERRARGRERDVDVELDGRIPARRRDEQAIGRARHFTARLARGRAGPAKPHVALAVGAAVVRSVPSRPSGAIVCNHLLHPTLTGLGLGVRTKQISRAGPAVAMRPADEAPMRLESWHEQPEQRHQRRRQTPPPQQRHVRLPRLATRSKRVRAKSPARI